MASTDLAVVRDRHRRRRRGGGGGGGSRGGRGRRGGGHRRLRRGRRGGRGRRRRRSGRCRHRRRCGGTSGGCRRVGGHGRGMGCHEAGRALHGDRARAGRRGPGSCGRRRGRHSCRALDRTRKGDVGRLGRGRRRWRARHRLTVARRRLWRFLRGRPITEREPGHQAEGRGRAHPCGEIAGSPGRPPAPGFDPGAISHRRAALGKDWGTGVRSRASPCGSESVWGSASGLGPVWGWVFRPSESVLGTVRVRGARAPAMGWTPACWSPSQQESLPAPVPRGGWPPGAQDGRPVSQPAGCPRPPVGRRRPSWPLVTPLEIPLVMPQSLREYPG